MREKYFIDTEDYNYMVVIGEDKDYPRFNFFVKDGDKWSVKMTVNDDIWTNLGVKFMEVLTTHFNNNPNLGYSFKTKDSRKVDVYERFLNQNGFIIERGSVNLVKPQ
jgi:hypothetical protein